MMGAKMKGPKHQVLLKIFGGGMYLGDMYVPYMYIYIFFHNYIIHKYIYIQRERERETLCIYMYEDANCMYWLTG